MIFPTVIVVLLLSIIVLLVLIVRKISRIDAATWNLPVVLEEKVGNAEARLYKQLEALHALNVLIKPVVPLPPMRGWAGSPDFLLELARVVLQRLPGRIVECSSGVSTVVAARCCQLNDLGHVFSLEHEPQFAAVTRERLREAGLEDWATVIDAPLVRTEISGTTFDWYDLSALPAGTCDLLVVDGPPAAIGPLARYPAGPQLIPRVAPGGIIVVDDADRPDERAMLERWRVQFPELSVREAQAEKGLVLVEKSRRTQA